MPTHNQISVLVEVAQSGGIDLNAAQKQELPSLLSGGLIQRASEKPEKYRLTDTGQTTLDERGVGANES